ncbi:MAG TPA: PilZ domain-containing protein [Thermoanaerobaculia bacterium]|nr:PilZ domain-containing protein [Thermoanaerobaculia bacterium]
MLLPADATFRRDELSEMLKLSPSVVDALFTGGALRSRDGAIAATELERLFRDSLLRLYQAQAMRTATRANDEREIEIEIESQPDPDAPVITRTLDDNIAMGERPDLRAGVRYVPRKQIGGTFRDVKFVMLQLSSSGLRIRHDTALRPGDEARLSFAIQHPAKSFVMRARVIWTSITQRDDRSFYISGLRVTENVERLVNAAYLLRTARELHVDESGRRMNGRSVPRHVSGLPDEEVVAIVQAVRALAADPEEAAKWYARARFAIADEEIRKAAPRGAREREEVVGVWEYLQRKTDLRAVAGVMQWIRSSQVMAV